MPNNVLIDTLAGIITAKNNIQTAITAKGGTLGGDGLSFCAAAIDTIPTTPVFEWIPSDWVSLESSGEYVNYLFLVPDGEILTINYNPAKFPNCIINFNDGPNPSVSADDQTGLQTRVIGLDVLAGMTRTSDNYVQVVVGITPLEGNNISSFGDIDFNRHAKMVKSNTPSATSMNLAGIQVIDIGENQSTSTTMCLFDSPATVYNNLETILNLTLHGTDISFASECVNLKYIQNIFLPDIIELSGSNFFPNLKRIDNFYSPQLTSLVSLFAYNSLEYVGDIVVPSCLNFQNTFYGCTNLKEIRSITTSIGTNFGYMFSECYSLTKLPAVLDTTLSTITDYMFSNCRSLEYSPIMNLTNAVSMQGMFNNCKSIKSIIISGTIPLTIESGGFNDAFYGLNSLESFDFQFSGGIIPFFANNQYPKLRDLKNIGYFFDLAATDVWMHGYSEITSLNLTGLTNLTNITLQGFTKLSGLTIQNWSILRNLSINYTNLSTDTLITIIDNLPTIPVEESQGQLSIVGCLGTLMLDQTYIDIAISKNWNVSASPLR